MGAHIPTTSGPNGAYSEQFTDSGDLRSRYAAFYQKMGWTPESLNNELISTMMKEPMGDRIRLFPLPIILSEQDHDEIIRNGARERALTLQAAFSDIVLGDQNWLRSLDAENQAIVERIFAEDGIAIDELRAIWKDKNPDEIRFVYGPDISRLPNGSWVVTEDNIGRIGAMGDTYDLVSRFCELSGLRLRTSPVFDLEKAIEKFVKDLGYEPEDPEVLGLISIDAPEPQLNPRNYENTRRLRAMQNLGIRTTHFETISEADRKLILDGTIKVLVNFDIRAWKPKKKEFFYTIFRDNSTHCFEAPGVKLMCSKRWLPFMDDMIRFFQDKEPTLPTQPTYFMNQVGIPENPKDWVVKEIGKCSGNGVYIFKDMTAEQISATSRELSQLEKKHQELFTSPLPLIKQKLLNPSYLSFRADANLLERFNVELRPYVYVTGNAEAYTATLNCATVVPLSLGDSRNSINRGAFEAIVLNESQIG